MIIILIDYICENILHHVVYKKGGFVMSEHNTSGLTLHNENIKKLTRQCLQEALIILLEKKNFEEISVTDICKKAGVSRMAFYSNFLSKEELFKHIVTTLNSDFISAVGTPFSSVTDYNWYLHFFSVMTENRNTVKIVFSADKYQYLDTINKIVLANKHRRSETEKFERLMWTGAIVNTIIYWLDYGMKQSAEELATICFQKLNGLVCP